MPTLPTVPPADRFFARLEKFQCACPSCGRLLTSHQDQGHLGKHFNAQKKPAARPDVRRLTRADQLTWNPYTQRLTCPWCRASFVAGLLLYPSPPARRRHDAPADTRLTRSERLELARLAGGWCAEQPYAREQPVNVFVPGACSCPEQGWAEGCALHGNRRRRQPPAAEATPHENLTRLPVYSSEK